jgi:hypothetical protein
MSEDEDEADPQQKAVPAPSNRTVTIAVCVAAAIALLVAVFAHHWLANPNARAIGVGLLSTEACDPVSERCESKSNSDVIEEVSRVLPADERWIGQAPETPSSWFPRFGIVTFGLGLLAAAALLGAAAIALANKRPELPITPPTVALVALILAIPAACLFAATKPDAVPLGVSWSFWLFGGGDVLGLLGALLVSRQLRPADPDLLADAMNPDDFPS